ncbi:MAG: phenylalanine--tRNA ligase subunit beta, partial [Thermomicrobiales bacterium]|nr:phenylalanine--tRNA ligase subunit beta [Thermomicrobiales bacterium]
IRSINNVVDVTNYVMLEYGQPLHAFDHDQLHGNRIIVRRGGDGEQMETLDHVQRTLDSEMLVIADANRAIALAGVMGGTDTEVSDTTTSVLLESASFDMKATRRTSRLLKLRSDASARFERGVDPDLASAGIARALELLLDVSPGAEVVEIADVYPAPVQPRVLTMPFDRIERLLGVRFTTAEVDRTLTDLGFEPRIEDDSDGTNLTVTIPTFRSDVSIPEDIVEEVGRILGYDRVPATLPVGQTVPVVRDPSYLLQTRIRQVLTSSGASEAVTYITTSDTMLSTFVDENGTAGILTPQPVESLIRLVNPLNADRPYLRNTLIPALLEVVSANLRHHRRVSFFELARVYLPLGPNELPNEVQTLGLVMAGNRDDLDRFASSEQLDFFDLKGVIEATLRGVGVGPVHVEAAESPGFHPGRTAAILVGDQQIGLFGELHPSTAEAYGIDGIRVCAAELDVDALVARSERGSTSISSPRFLPVEQDLAVVVANETPAAAVEEALRAGAGPLLTSVVLFDVFYGTQIGEENKSLAYRLTFTSPGRALTDDDLVKVRGKIERTLKQRVQGRLRA